MKTQMFRRTAPVALVGILAVTALAGCGSKKDDNTATPGASASATTSTLTKDDALAALVPEKIRNTAKLQVATDASYAPNEFFDTDGKTIIGFDVDLGDAIGTILGLDPEFTNTGFDGIIASLGSRYDIGMSSFTDNKEREKVVDMVTYFNAGTSFAVKGGSTLVLNTLDDLCGHSAAAEKGTTQADDLAAQATKCEKDGKAKLNVLTFPDQNGANLAVTSGRADAVLADAPVNAYAVKQSNGALSLSGSEYGAAPYGIAIPKSAEYKGLADAILGAVQKLIANGQYAQILTKWGLSTGAITESKINGAL